MIQLIVAGKVEYSRPDSMWGWEQIFDIMISPEFKALVKSKTGDAQAYKLKCA